MNNDVRKSLWEFYTHTSHTHTCTADIKKQAISDHFPAGQTVTFDSSGSSPPIPTVHPPCYAPHSVPSITPHLCLTFTDYTHRKGDVNILLRKEMSIKWCCIAQQIKTNQIIE